MIEFTGEEQLNVKLLFGHPLVDTFSPEKQVSFKNGIVSLGDIDLLLTTLGSPCEKLK